MAELHGTCAERFSDVRDALAASLDQDDVGASVAWRRAEIPSGAGYGNARSVAAVQSLLACGGTVGGVRLLSRAGCERALEEQYHGMDYHLGVSMRYGMGYGTSGRTCFWGGMGGSLVFNDFDAGMTVAYVMNQMLDRGLTSDDRGMTMVMAAYGGLAPNSAHP